VNWACQHVGCNSVQVSTQDIAKTSYAPSRYASSTTLTAA
jgi:hypothetical protein